MRAFVLKLARSANGIGAKLDLNTRKQSKTIIADLQEFLTTEENADKTVLGDPFIENWSQTDYQEVLGTALADTVLELAGEKQEQDARAAALLDDPALAPNTGESGTTATRATVTQTQTTEQTQTQEQQELVVPPATIRAAQPAAPTATTRGGNNAMPPPPIRTPHDTQDDSTEYMEFMQLQGDAQQPQGITQDALLAALHEANEQGIDINGVIDMFSEQAQEVPPVATVPAGNAMSRPIPKKQRHNQGYLMAGKVQNQQTVTATDANMTYFNTMFPSDKKVGGIPIPTQQQDPGYGFPYNMIGPSDNAQMMGYQPQGTNKNSKKKEKISICSSKFLYDYR